MRKLLKYVLFSTTIICLLFACSDDDDGNAPKGYTLYENSGSWDCALSESCQDVYEFVFQSGSRVAVIIEEVTGGSVVRLAIHAPNVNLGGTNLLTGNSDDLMCTGPDEDATVPNFIASSDGVYKIVITRDWGLSAGFDGTYNFVLFSDTSFEFVEQSIDDVDSLAENSTCP